MKFKASIDTGALISLQLSGLLENSLKYFSFIVGSSIKRELEQFVYEKDILGLASVKILELIGNNQIQHIKIIKERKGEDEAVEIMEKYKCDYVISDDIGFVKKKSKIINNIRFSVFVIFILFYAKEISKTDAQESINKIFELRSWSDNLITLYAKELLNVM
ncbi:MAG: hypothetical protein HY051_00570 [Candidatus Aenigmarchaeota archaeon]|nr:hypothetical protein [Candidatus Aenigmarchaeota archaeon]